MDRPVAAPDFDRVLAPITDPAESPRHRRSAAPDSSHVPAALRGSIAAIGRPKTSVPIAATECSHRRATRRDESTVEVAVVVSAVRRESAGVGFGRSSNLSAWEHGPCMLVQLASGAAVVLAAAGLHLLRTAPRRSPSARHEARSGERGCDRTCRAGAPVGDSQRAMVTVREVEPSGPPWLWPRCHRVAVAGASSDRSGSC